MNYDFDTVISRRNTDSLKWNVAEHELPMWVADMDFRTAPEILTAISDRVGHGIFGYSIIQDEWYQAYIGWWQSRHDFTMKKEWLHFCTGVVPAISSVIRKLTTPAEKVLVQTPVYNAFFGSIVNNGRQILESGLKYRDGVYEIDFDDLERKLADPQTTLMILCNPHNPVGKIWDRDTLERIGELCWKHHVIVLSDEIHCDLTDPGTGYIPFASVSEKCRDNSVTCLAPTKTFNLAGLKTAAVVIPNSVLRQRVVCALNTDGIAEANAFAVAAAVAAFTQGGAWLDELRQYIFENKKTVAAYIEEKIPQVRLVPSQATYLLWLDCSGVKGAAGGIARRIREKTGLFLTDGGQYGKNGENFLRMNIACPRVTLEDGLNRLREGILACEEEM